MLQWLHTQPLKSSILKNRNLEQYFFFTFDNSCCCWYSYILQTAISKKMTLAYFMFLTWLWKKFVCLYSDAFLYLFFYENHKKIRWFEYELLCQKRIGRQPKLQLFHFSSSLLSCRLLSDWFLNYLFLWGHSSKHELCFISVLDEILLNSSTASNSNFSIIERRFIERLLTVGKIDACFATMFATSAVQLRSVNAFHATYRPQKFVMEMFAELNGALLSPVSIYFCNFKPPWKP